MYFITVLCKCNASFDVAGYNAILKKKINVHFDCDRYIKVDNVLIASQ